MMMMVAQVMQCESPDEEALVSSGGMLGVEFVDRNPGEVSLHCFSFLRDFDLLVQ